ncbi:MAG: hypothetical protein NTZ38_02545 [Candidatus Taylorbacteria bacterium]|nr:hypothetical protein [Candidatus Taylorbacteria bacterium]
MTPEERSLLERTYKLSVENNDILHGINRSNKISSIMRAIYWVIVIGISVGAYYYVQPYVNPMMKLYGEVMDNVGNLSSILRSNQ